MIINIVIFEMKDKIQDLLEASVSLITAEWKLNLLFKLMRAGAERLTKLDQARLDQEWLLPPAAPEAQLSRSA